MKYLAALSILLLGCESSPRVIEKPVYVDVPVVKPCVRSIPAEPEYETSRLTAADDTDTVATAYMVEREQRKIYIKQLQSKLAGCVPPTGWVLPRNQNPTETKPAGFR